VTSNILGLQGYDRIKAMLLNGDIAMGERLIETQLAARLGISRTPVREALRLLHAEGYVVFSNPGFYAATYGPARVAEIYGCRALLESEAVRLLARRGLDAGAHAGLEAVLRRTDSLFDRESDPDKLRETFLKLNNAFHHGLYEACGNATLQELIERTTNIPTAIRTYFHFDDDQLEQSQRTHWNILRAVHARDGERAAALMREHIWSAKDRMIAPEETLAPPRAAAS